MTDLTLSFSPEDRGDAWLAAQSGATTLGAMRRYVKQRKIDRWRRETNWGRVDVLPLTEADMRGAVPAWPLDGMIQREAIETVQASMTAEQFDLLRLDANDYTCNEIAAMKDAHPVSVRGRILRARNRARAAMKAMVE